MIEPTEKDIGRKVVYRDLHREAEEGVISSLSDIPGHVFVKFRGPTGELTLCNQLEWIS